MLLIQIYKNDNINIKIFSIVILLFYQFFIIDRAVSTVINWEVETNVSMGISNFERKILKVKNYEIKSFVELEDTCLLLKP